MTPRHYRAVRAFPLVSVLALGFALRVWGLTWGLWNARVEQRPQPDEWVVYWLFRWFGQNHNLNPCPDAAHGQCFFDWGAVYPYLAYLVHGLSSWAMQGVYLGPHADPAFVQAVLAGRITSAAVSTATIVAVYLLGRLAQGHWVGVLAALIVSLSGLLIELAHFASPDSTTLLLCTLTLIAALWYYHAPSLRRLMLAGLGVGLAAGSEYHMVLLAIPLLAAWILAPLRRVLWLLGAAVAAAVVYLVSNPYIPFAFGGFETAMLHTLRIRTVDSTAEYGDRFASYGPDWLYPVRYILGYGVGAAATAWIVTGAAWSVVSRRRQDVILLTWAVPYAVLISLSSAKFLRYGAPLLPALAVLAGGAAVDLWRRTRSAGRAALLTAAVAVVAYTGVYDAAYAGLFASPDPRLAAIRWLDGHAPRGTPVAFAALPDGVVNMPYFASAAGYRPCFALYQPQRLNGPAQYVVLDSYSQEEHSGYSDAQVTRFTRALNRDPNYRRVASIHYVPTFLGLSFPLHGSPHDWRYPAHDITIYRHMTHVTGTASYCFPNVSSAVAALYVPTARS